MGIYLQSHCRGLCNGSMALARSTVCFTARSRGKPSIMALHCGRCFHKIDAIEGMQLFMRRHMPDASVHPKFSVTTSLGARRTRLASMTGGARLHPADKFGQF